MSNNTFNSMALANDSNVIDLTALLEERGRSSMARDFRELAAQVDGMSRQLTAAAREISAMRRELAELRGQHGTPLLGQCRQDLAAASRGVSQARERLAAVKSWISQGAKDAAAAIREKGIAALNGAVSFLGVRKELEQLQQDATAGIGRCNRSLAKVENISRQYHQLGSAVRNYGRAIRGREIQDDVKESGRLARLAAAPHHAMKKLHTGIQKGTTAAMDQLEKLEQAAERSSVMDDLQAGKDSGKDAPQQDEGEKGYVIAVCDDSRFYIPDAQHIERNDSLSPWVYQDDVEAAKGAEQDGVRLIYGMEHVADGVYLDTPENRDIIRQSLERFPEYLDVGTPGGPELVPDQGAPAQENAAAQPEKDSAAASQTAKQDRPSILADLREKKEAAVRDAKERGISLSPGRGEGEER